MFNSLVLTYLLRVVHFCFVDKPTKPFKEILDALQHSQFCFAAGNITRPESARVDPEGGDFGAGLITDVVMAKVGKATGHPYSIEQSEIEQIVHFTNAEENGLKCRLEHPEQGKNAKLGATVGILKNARVVGDQAVADLHILKSSRKSPQGDLGGYVLELASEQPDFVSLSIFGSARNFYWYNGAKQININSEKQLKEFIEASKGQTPVYIRLYELDACDLVDKGALTEGLFAASSDPLTRYIADYEQQILFSKTMSKPKRLAFSINATTDAMLEITIKTDNPTPAVGDEVVMVDANGVESPAPDGAHVISAGPLDGSTITVKDGKIESIDTPVAASTETAAEVAASSGHQAVLAAIAGLEAKFEARVAALEKTPLAMHAGTGGTDTFQGNQSGKTPEASSYQKIAMGLKPDGKKKFTTDFLN